MQLISFVFTSFIVILIPGAGVFYTLAVGMTKGRKQSVKAALGCTLGILPHLCLSIAIFSALLIVNSAVFAWVRILGAVFLFFLGCGMLITKMNSTIATKDTANKGKQVVLRGFLLNLLNPQLTLFFFSFLPQYVDKQGLYYVEESFILGLLFMILTFIVFLVYGLLAGVAEQFLLGSQVRVQWMQRLFGVVFICFSLTVFYKALLYF